MLITVETLLEFVLKFCLNLLKLFFHKWLGMQCMPCMHGEYAPAFATVTGKLGHSLKRAQLPTG